MSSKEKGNDRLIPSSTNRSGYQRGVEHWREIEEGISTHPMVIHFWEVHGGRKQDCLMRILSGHLTPLDRQTTESINILDAEKTQGRSLNLKTEWGGAKIPGILVTQQKGLSRIKEKEDSNTFM